MSWTVTLESTPTMRPYLPLDQMTLEEKLETMEAIWRELCRAPDEMPSPSWHGDVLRAREQEAKAGTATFSPLAEVAARLRNLKQCK